MPLRMQNVNDWRKKFGVVSQVAKEVISFMLWERQKYTSGTTTTLTYFSAGTTGFNGNLQAGQLPNGNSFLIQALRIAPIVSSILTADAAVAAGANTGSAVQAILDLITNSTATLKVGEKFYGTWPIMTLPAGSGVWGNVAARGTSAAGSGSTADFASNGVPDLRNVYSFPLPITIPPQYNFSVTLNFEAAITLPTPPGDIPIYVMLDGQLIRPVQ